MMRRCLLSVLVFAALWGACAEAVRAEQILVDFGTKNSPVPSPDARGRHWNNAMGTGPESMDERFQMDLVTTEGKSPGIRLQVASAFKRSNTTKATQCPWYPPEAMDRWMGYSRAEGKPAAALRLQGLKQGVAYELIVYAINDVPEGGKARGPGMLFAAGGKTGRLIAANNVDQRLTLSDLHCESDGTLLLTINEGGAGAGLISVLEVNYQERPAAKKKGRPKAATTPRVPEAPAPTPAPSAAPAAVPAAPASVPGAVPPEQEGEPGAMRLVLGGLLLLMGLGVAGFVVWFNSRK
jgi:hypothetical protein